MLDARISHSTDSVNVQTMYSEFQTRRKYIRHILSLKTHCQENKSMEFTLEFLHQCYLAMPDVSAYLAMEKA
jgi:hypothetical protein